MDSGPPGERVNHLLLKLTIQADDRACQRFGRRILLVSKRTLTAHDCGGTFDINAVQRTATQDLPTRPCLQNPFHVLEHATFRARRLCKVVAGGAVILPKLAHAYRCASWPS